MSSHYLWPSRRANNYGTGIIFEQLIPGRRIGMSMTYYFGSPRQRRLAIQII